MTSSPLGYLDAAGTRARSIVPLTWFTLTVSIVVCLVIGGLLWAAVRRGATAHSAADVRTVKVEQGSDTGIRWITIGLMISAVPLAATLVWTLFTLAAVASPPAHPGVVIDVTGHQFWWEIKYSGVSPAEQFATANEVHIPVGVSVLVRLHGADVIHSFWVPKLSGKTDAIPGQTNLSWLQADVPGRYLGQCSEFCGFQHAKMQFDVVAQPPAEYAEWVKAQLMPAPAPTTPEQIRGQQVVQYRCGLCHEVRGTEAGAVAGPDLTHLMSRARIAAGVLENNPGSLAGWIQSPQAIKPGNLMPNQDLQGTQLTDVLAYLALLK